MKFFANLKSNHTRKSFEKYAFALNEALSKIKNDDLQVTVFPSFTSFIDEKFSFKQGAQNFYPAFKGSFTGEICLEMLEEFNITSVLIGHSERRALGESDEFIKQKFNFAKDNKFDITLCIGESDITYMNGSTKEFLLTQLEDIDLTYDKLTIAYEPIWAIGSSKSAKAEYVEEILDFLKTTIFEKTGKYVSLLYGGSVNLDNSKEILSIESCDGVLVGSFSLDVNNFINLIKENI